MIYLVSNQTELFEESLFSLISLEESITILENISIIGLDTETTGLDCYTKKLLLLQLGNYDFQILFDIASFNYIIPPLLRTFLNTHKALYVIQNAKFDLKFLFRQGIILKSVYDTMLAETILTNGLSYDGRDLATLALKYCGVILDKSIRGRIISVGLSTPVLLYGAKDIKYLIAIKNAQEQFIADKKLTKALELDNSFVIVLAYIEYCGIKLDYKKWLKNTHASKESLHHVKKELNDRLLKDGYLKYFSGMLDMFDNTESCVINWNSPKQVIKLFKEYGINVTAVKKGKKIESIDAKVLLPQLKRFPILEIYLKYKELQKELSTYGESWARYINPVTSRVHTTYKQINDTGRLSSGSKFDNTPNMQNIPADIKFRSCFIPEDGNVMIDADYKGQETIVLANLSQEHNLIDFYKRGLEDMHSYVAFLMYKEIRICDVNNVTNEALEYIKNNFKDKRQLAKSAGFAIAYGGNGSTIAKNCNVPISDGEFVYNTYFKIFPKMKDYFDLGFQKSVYYGCIEFNPITKRKYFFNVDEHNYFVYREAVESPDFWVTTYNAKEIFRKYSAASNEIQKLSQNYPIQGTAGDITKYAGLLFFKEILKRDWWLKVKIVNVIHDEYLVECPSDISGEVKDILINCMEEAGKPFCKTVDLKASAEIGNYWVH